MAESLALLSDIHSNLEALDACVAHARQAGATRFALLGDIVGYGADPGAVVDRVMALAGDGATVVKGNHDEAVEGGDSHLNETAMAAIEWTRGVLDATQRAFLASLPLCLRHDDHCFVHASADRPERWTYVDGPGAARLCMNAAGTPGLRGHVHEQRLYFEQGGRDAERPGELRRDRHLCSLLSAVCSSPKRLVAARALIAAPSGSHRRGGSPHR